MHLFHIAICSLGLGLEHVGLGLGPGLANTGLGLGLLTTRQSTVLVMLLPNMTVNEFLLVYG